MQPTSVQYRNTPIWDAAESFKVLALHLKAAKDSGVDVPCTRAESEPEWWFSEEQRLEDRAKNLCLLCPVQPQCLRHALENDEVGIWGGLTRVERSALRRTLVANASSSGRYWAP